MSWHFLQEQAAVSWEGSSLDGAPSALLKMMPTRAVCYSLGSVTACCLDSPSGTMCERSMAVAGPVRSTWLREGSRARTSAQRDAEPGSMAKSPASGWKWQGSFAKYDPDSRSWKTRQSSLLGASGLFSETWPRWGSMLDGESLELPTPALRIAGTVSGLWPTPKASAAGPDFAKLKRSSTGISLQTAVAMYPTPRSTDGERGGRGDLIQAVRGNPNSHYRPLTKEGLYTTPCADDTNHRKGKYAQGGTALSTQVGGSLNPTWVEWLMGWPIGWTDCAAWGTDKFQQWRQWLSAFSLQKVPSD